MTTHELARLPDPDKEEWRPVAGYEGLYEVSCLGRVRSLDALIRNGAATFRLRRGRILRFKPRDDGYQAVSLSKDSVVIDPLVHQIVAVAFLPPDPDPARTDVNHKDFDKQNNRHTNLEWCTPLENVHHSGRAGRTGMKLNADLIRSIRSRLAEGATNRQLAKEFGVGKSRISDIRLGLSWGHVK